MSLLQIPGELRNMIYEFATDDDVDCDGLRCATCQSSAKIPPAWASAIHPHAEAQQSQHQDGLRALSQVCKALRFEVRPLLMASAKFRVKLSSIGRFLEAFYPEIHSPESESRDSRLRHAKGDIVILLAKDDGITDIDLIPLITLRQRAPDVGWQFKFSVQGHIGKGLDPYLARHLKYLVHGAMFGSWITKLDFSVRWSQYCQRVPHNGIKLHVQFDELLGPQPSTYQRNQGLPLPSSSASWTVDQLKGFKRLGPFMERVALLIEVLPENECTIKVGK
ncbi:hypothetical protein NX059_012077 [Plenodomus lindquistii]|nr:hypothetical protein NX059_012077 [Plenodomus lindquistii]